MPSPTCARIGCWCKPTPRPPSQRRGMVSSVPLGLVTCHGRENFGDHLAAIVRAIRRIALAHPSHRIVFPLHLNPNVRAAAVPVLGAVGNVHLLEPVAYYDSIYL